MGCLYALIAAGLSLIFGLMDVVNFAHGEFLMLAMYVAFFAWSLARLDPLASLPLAALALAALGWATYHGVIRRVLGGPMLAQIFATFGLGIFLRSGAQFLWGVDFRTVKEPLLAGRLSVGGVFVGRRQRARARRVRRALPLPVPLGDGARAPGDGAGPAGRRPHGHRHGPHVRAGLGDRERVRRRRGGPARD